MDQQQQRSYTAPIAFGVMFSILGILWIASYWYWLYRSVRMPSGTYQAWYEAFMAYGVFAVFIISGVLACIWALVELIVYTVVDLRKAFIRSRP